MQRVFSLAIPPGMKYAISLQPKSDGRRTSVLIDTMRRIAAELMMK